LALRFAVTAAAEQELELIHHVELRRQRTARLGGLSAIPPAIPRPIAILPAASITTGLIPPCGRPRRLPCCAVASSVTAAWPSAARTNTMPRCCAAAGRVALG
jgi:hypothetical protein